MMTSGRIAALCFSAVSAQFLPPGTQDHPAHQASGCTDMEDQPAVPGTSYVQHMSAKPPNANYEEVCASMSANGTEIRFNDPCAWARGDAQMTVAQFTNFCKGATRQIHWHDGADEWGYVNQGKLRTYVASPDGLPWPSSNNDISQHGVWYFPRGWLHGIMCLTPESEGGCVITLVFSGPVSVPIDNHNLDTTLAQAPDEIAAAALKVDLETYKKMRPSFANSAGPVVNATVASSPLVTMVQDGFCEPACPDIVQTRAAPAAADAADVEKTVHLTDGVTLHQIKTSSFSFASTMSQERTELAPGAFRPLVWVANADALLTVTAGSITVGLQGGHAGSANEHEPHVPYTEQNLGPGDVAYFPIGRAYWFKEETGTAAAAAITIFNVGEWRSVEMQESMALMPAWAVSSNLRQSSRLSGSHMEV